MNSIKGNIAQIEFNGSLSLVSVSVTDTITLKSIVVETPETASYLKKGNTVQVLFKETEVVIGVGDNPQVSLQNRIPSTVKFIETGTLISKLVLDTEVGLLEAVISTNAIQQLQIENGSQVLAMVKLNETMLSV